MHGVLTYRASELNPLRLASPKLTVNGPKLFLRDQKAGNSDLAGRFWTAAKVYTIPQSSHATVGLYADGPYNRLTTVGADSTR